MHAGIINAGGILVIRLSPLLCHSHAALLILCAVGTFTAVFASLAMLTQASVKRCLAFSTVGQMGFMMLECGLGAFHLALLHLVAHSLYKAYAFLSSGGAVLRETRAPAQTVSPMVLVAGVAGGGAVSFAAAEFMGVSVSAHLALIGVFALGMAQMFWTIRSWIGLILGASFGLCVFLFGQSRPADRGAVPLESVKP